jgi:hypothetical protein
VSALIKAVLGATVPAFIGMWITARLTTDYINGLPKLSPDAPLGVIANAILVGFLVEIAGCVGLFAFLRRRHSRQLRASTNI